MEDHGGVVPAYAETVLGQAEEEEGDGRARRTGRRVIADRPGGPSGRQPAAQRMAGPAAPEIERPDAELEEADLESDDNGAAADADLAEQPAEVAGDGASDDAARERAERRARRQARQKRKHGRR